MEEFNPCDGGDIEGVFFVSTICLSCPKFQMETLWTCILWHSILPSSYRCRVFQGRASFSIFFLWCSEVPANLGSDSYQFSAFIEKDNLVIRGRSRHEFPWGGGGGALFIGAWWSYMASQGWPILIITSSVVHYLNQCWPTFHWTVRNKLECSIGNNHHRSQKYIWNCRLQNGSHFEPVLLCWYS